MDYYYLHIKTILHMRKIVLALIALLYTCLLAGAQDIRFGKFDFELGFEIPVAAASHPGKTNASTPAIHIEGRWQLRAQPIDLGFHIGLSVVKRKFDDDYESYRSVPSLAVAHYQFGRGTRFNPYAGLGIGISQNVILNEWDTKGTDFAAMPCIGIRCWRSLNISFSYLVTRKDYSRLLANIGFYF